jgi:hypothetical protein
MNNVQIHAWRGINGEFDLSALKLGRRKNELSKNFGGGLWEHCFNLTDS